MELVDESKEEHCWDAWTSVLRSDLPLSRRLEMKLIEDGKGDHCWGTWMTLLRSNFPWSRSNSDAAVTVPVVFGVRIQPVLISVLRTCLH